MNFPTNVALDIDDTLCDWFGAYLKVYPKDLEDSKITRNVEKLRFYKDFWLNLEPINSLDFEPICYCTKRVIPKGWTRKWLINNGFPNKPIYQLYYQHGNKADYIKGIADVLIDDSLNNYNICNSSGMKTILYDRFNKYPKIPFRITTLDYESIINIYNQML